MSVLCPFSAGFIYNRTNKLRGLLTRVGGESGKPAWGDPLAHHSNFGSRYRHSDWSFFLEPLESWDTMIEDPRPLFDVTVSPPLQPTWSFDDPFSEVTTSLRRIREEDDDNNDVSLSIANYPVQRTTRVELLAWYSPAHTNEQNEYRTNRGTLFTRQPACLLVEMPHAKTSPIGSPRSAAARDRAGHRTAQDLPG